MTQHESGGSPVVTPATEEVWDDQRPSRREQVRLAVAQRAAGVAVPLVIGGGLLGIVGALLPWAQDPAFSYDLTYAASPVGPQRYALVAGLLLMVVGAFVLRTPARLAARGFDAGRLMYLAVPLGWGLAGVALGVILGLATETMADNTAGPGLYVALVAGLLAWLGANSVIVRDGAPATPPAAFTVRRPAWVEIITVAAVIGLALLVVAMCLNETDAATLLALLALLAGLAVALTRAGVFAWFSSVAARHRRVTMLAGIATALLFPFTQNGSEANMSIATQVLIFAAVAIGLNIVVGLAGLLDLGYVAFLGVGAYTAAALSGSAFATIGIVPPFWVTAILGAVIASIAGLIIGTPTLRVRGDYLAIVTLAFGEIFRLAMFNLDGTNGPNITRGPNGIPAIPDLEVFGFNYGQTHDIAGVTLGRFSNYYYLLLALLAVIVTVFIRVNASRIGRAWVAMREDETAAEAMGISTFKLKLLAFAGGAFLAGMAGTIKAHHDVSVTPDQYVFLESAFLLAAVVLGGMGSVGGVILGATLLKLLPEKLRFFSEYRLLIFGLLLVLMMRFRPEGMIPSNRTRQLLGADEDADAAGDGAAAIQGEVAR